MTAASKFQACLPGALQRAFSKSFLSKRSNKHRHAEVNIKETPDATKGEAGIVTNHNSHIISQKGHPANESSTLIPQQQPPPIPTKPRSFDDVYKLGSAIGKGNYAIVREATHKVTKNKYAVKIIKKSRLKGMEHVLVREIEILKKLGFDDHIVTLLPQDSFFQTSTEFFLVMELCKGGELFNAIAEIGSYTEADARDIVLQILNALQYCHSKGIIHRDLKPENLLLKSKKGKPYIVITDFGLSRILSDDKQFVGTTCGTPGYVAPEVLKARGYNFSADLWSVGCITYVLLCGYLPFWGPNQNALFQEILRGRFTFENDTWGHISETAKSFISELLVVDPTRRLTAVTALQHPWITSGRATLPRHQLLPEMKRGKVLFKSAVNSIIAANKMQRSALLYRVKRSDSKLSISEPPSTHSSNEQNDSSSLSAHEIETLENDTRQPQVVNTGSHNKIEIKKQSPDESQVEEISIAEENQSLANDRMNKVVSISQNIQLFRALSLSAGSGGKPPTDQREFQTNAKNIITSSPNSGDIVPSKTSTNTGTTSFQQSSESTLLKTRGGMDETRPAYLKRFVSLDSVDFRRQSDIDTILSLAESLTGVKPQSSEKNNNASQRQKKRKTILSFGFF